MRIAKLLFIFLSGVLMIQCTPPSLHPLFTEENLVFEPALVGTWTNEKGDETWTFQKSSETAYELIHVEKGVSAKFEARLVRMEDFLFLDVYPQDPNIQNEFYKAHLILGHTFARVWIDEDVLHLSILDHD